MKRISEKVVKGKRRVTVELEDGEQLVAVSETEHYRVPHPIDEIFLGYYLLNADQVSWCSVQQKWVA